MNSETCTVCGRAVNLVDPHTIPQSPGLGEGAVFGVSVLCKACASARHRAGHRHS